MFKSLYYNNGKILQNVSYCYQKKEILLTKYWAKEDSEEEKSIISMMKMTSYKR